MPGTADAYVDGELDLQASLAFEARLRTEPALQAEVDALRALRTAVRERASYHVAPAGWLALPGAAPAQPGAPDVAPAATPSGLPPSAEPASVAVPPAPARRPRASALDEATGWRRWFAWRPYLPAAALAVLAVTGLQTWQRATDADALLLQETIAAHVRSTVSQRLIDVASSDQHTVKPWLSARLDYSPPVPDPPLPGMVALGGRIDYVDGRPVAVLVWRQRQHLVDAFVWPAGSEADSAPRSAAQRGFNSVRWTRGGMHWRLVSDISRDELLACAQALQAGPDGGER